MITGIQFVYPQTRSENTYLTFNQLIDQLEDKYKVQLFYKSEWFERRKFNSAILKLSFKETLNRIKTETDFSIFTIDSALYVFVPVKPIEDSDQEGTGQFLPGELFAPTSPVDIVTYFNADWLSGDIYLADGRVIRDKKIKYNGFLDELFWLESESNQVVMLDKEAIQQFHFINYQGDTSVNFMKLKVKRNSSNDSIEIFGQELYHGGLSLFVLHSFYFDKAVTVQVDKRNILKDIYKKDPVYYVKFINNSTVEFRRFSRKNLYAFAPDKKDQIRKFLNESNSGRSKTTPEIIGLIQFLDTIVD